MQLGARLSYKSPKGCTSVRTEEHEGRHTGTAHVYLRISPAPLYIIPAIILLLIQCSSYHTQMYKCRPIYIRSLFLDPSDRSLRNRRTHACTHTHIHTRVFMQIFASYRNVSLKFARRSKLHPARAPTCGAFIIFRLFVVLISFGRRDLWIHWAFLKLWHWMTRDIFMRKSSAIF